MGEIALNTSSPTFEEELQAVFAEGKPQVFFDCVTGQMGRQVTRAMPNGSQTYWYGDLDPAGPSVTEEDLAGNGKKAEGFLMHLYVEANPELKEVFTKKTLEDFVNGNGKVLIRDDGRFALSDFEAAFAQVFNGGTEGKIILSNSM